MKITSINPQDNYRNYESKEKINCYELIGIADNKGISLAKIRWYMGRSSSAMTVYCYVFVHSHAMPVEHNMSWATGSGTAGGGGYCKQSAAFYEAISDAGIKFDEEIHGRGLSVVEEALEAIAKQAGFNSFYISRG